MKFSRISGVDLNKVKKIASKNRAKKEDRRSPLIVEGDDVIFNMNMEGGYWKGVPTSEMAQDHEGRQLLKWVLRKDFDEDAQEIIGNQLKEVMFDD